MNAKFCDVRPWNFDDNLSISVVVLAAPQEGTNVNVIQTDAFFFIFYGP